MGASSEIAIVYQARNLVNGHRYIGFTTRGLEVRKAQHLKSAREKKQAKFRFQHAIAKYGPDNFAWEILGDFDGDEDLAKLYEREAIAKYRPEYNLSHGGDGGRLSDESRAKLSASKMGVPSPIKGIPKTAEHRANMRIGMTGVPHLAARGKKRDPAVVERIRQKTKGHPNYNTKPMSDETKAKLSAANKGQVPWIKGLRHSEETKRKIGLAHKKVWENPDPDRVAALRVSAAAARESLKKPVICLNDGQVFDSGGDAARFYGFSRSQVSQAVTGKRVDVHGVRFARYEAPK